MTFGKRVREARESLGITQQELADHVGISRAHVSRIELDQAGASHEALTQLVKRLGLSVEDVCLPRSGE